MLKWLQLKRQKEKQYPIPPVSKDESRVSPALCRHYKAIKTAMENENLAEVGNRQRRLAKNGAPVPITLSQVKDLIEEYKCY